MDDKIQWEVFHKNLVYEKRVPNCKYFFTGRLKTGKYNLIVDTQ